VVSEYISGDVEFCFLRPEARGVFLCGDFNSWNRTALPMTRMDGGWWKCRLRLAAGTYQFKYLADSEWYPDYAAFGLERGPFGTWNSVVLVKPEPADAEPRRAPAADIARVATSEVRLSAPAKLTRRTQTTLKGSTPHAI
jgi:1,4-alpha-glucan branching enzyme